MQREQTCYTYSFMQIVSTHVVLSRAGDNISS